LSAAGRTAERRRRAQWERRALGIVLVVLVFVLGVALGEALHDNPKPGGNRMFVRTLQPSTLPPVRETVTVTGP
jgi:hypothetical protein